MANTWKYWEKLENGEAVFIQETGEIAIEKDYRHLVTARPAELFEVFQRWPELIDRVTKKRNMFQCVDGDVINTLQGRIINLEFEAAERQNVTAALKQANSEKDSLIIDLMADVENEKRKGRSLMCWIGQIGAKKN